MQVHDGLKQGLKSMVVNILIHIECCEDVECVAKVYLSRNSDITAKDREKVYGTDHRVNVNNRHNLVTIVVEVRLNYPHAVVGFIGYQV